MLYRLNRGGIAEKPSNSMLFTTILSLFLARRDYEHTPHRQIDHKQHNRPQKRIKEENIAFSYAFPCERAVMIIVSNAQIAVRTVKSVLLCEGSAASTGLKGRGNLRI